MGEGRRYGQGRVGSIKNKTEKGGGGWEGEGDRGRVGIN